MVRFGLKALREKEVTLSLPCQTINSICLIKS
jgi:hypothetical protein